MDIEDKILHEFTKEMRETYIGFDLACFLVERGKAHFEFVPKEISKGE